MTRRLVPVAIIAAFSAILVSYLVYTWQIAEELRRGANVFSQIYFQVVQAAASPEGMSPEGEFQLLLELYDLGIPVVQTDLEGRPTLVKNLPFEADLTVPEDVERVQEYVARLDLRNPPLVDEATNFEVHYGEPLFLRRLKWIPWLQAALLLGVVGTGVWMIRTSSRAERERIWTAMARESAHQMGTPLSSLVGWLELLESSLPESARKREGFDLLTEMGDDVGRLEKVSRRFELIGHAPALRPVNASEVIRRLGRYFSLRLPSLGSRVRLELDLPDDGPVVRGNETLIEWAFESLFKNALDSLAGSDGRISVSYLGTESGKARFRFADDGPGVPMAVRGTLFDVGVTTREGGWGVGLSLARRIIEDMHGGSVHLEHTGAGASFFLELPLYESQS